MAALATLVALAGPSPAPAAPPAVTIERARHLMGTLCTMVVDHADSTRASGAVSAALDEIHRLEGVMSAWRDDSELARFNRAAAAGPSACSADLAAVLDSALALARLTEGAFDPTVGPLMDAWDLRGEGRVPAPATLAAARARTGWSDLALERGAGGAGAGRFMKPGMAIDLGGIGKGYALDRAAATLARLGARRAIINLGGEVMTVGGGHVVTVAHPASRLTAVVELEVDAGCVSTSGQSERGFTAGGVRYGHVLDPRSGAPARTAASVTVVCRSATRADALATALLVMGRQTAARFLDGRDDIGVLWLEPAGDAVRAWRWNLPAARAVPGAAVGWMDGNQAMDPATR